MQNQSSSASPVESPAEASPRTNGQSAARAASSLQNEHPRESSAYLYVGGAASRQPEIWYAHQCGNLIGVAQTQRFAENLALGIVPCAQTPSKQDHGFVATLGKNNRLQISCCTYLGRDKVREVADCLREVCFPKVAGNFRWTNSRAMA